MDTIKYVQSFSSGQITVPKIFRDHLNLGSNFWLKLELIENQIIAKPISSTTPNNYAQKLLELKGGWLDKKEFQKNRSQINKRPTLNAV